MLRLSPPWYSENPNQCDKSGNHNEANADEPEQEVEFGIHHLEFAFEAVDEVGGDHFFDKLREQVRIPALKAGAGQDVVKLCAVISRSDGGVGT